MRWFSAFLTGVRVFPVMTDSSIDGANGLDRFDFEWNSANASMQSRKAKNFHYLLTINRYRQFLNIKWSTKFALVFQMQYWVLVELKKKAKKTERERERDRNTYIF